MSWRGFEWLVAIIPILGCGSSGGAGAPDAGRSATGAAAGSGGALDAGGWTGNGASGGSGARAASGGSLGSGAAGGSGGDSVASGSGGMSAGSGSKGSTNWLRQFGTDADEGALGMGVDDQGNVVVLYNNGNVLNGLISKFDGSGNELWTIETRERLVALAVAPDGSVFAVGTVVVEEADMRSSQALLVSYDATGSARFRTTFGSIGLDTVQQVAAGDDGHGFVVWNRAEAIDGGHGALSEFDSAGTELSTAGFGKTDSYLNITPDRRGSAYAMGADPDYFIRKFNLQGDEVWTARVSARPSALYADNDENLFFTIASPAAFAKLDPSGQLVLNLEFGGPDDWAGLVATDSEGNIFVSSATMPGARATTDALVYRFDPEGNELGRWSITSDAYDFISAIAVDPNGAAIVAGRTEGTLPNQMSFGGDDAFVARIQP
jgi:hypothetical protein